MKENGEMGLWEGGKEREDKFPCLAVCAQALLIQWYPITAFLMKLV